MLYGHRPENHSLRHAHAFAVVIFLPEHLDEIIAPLRERFDPDYNIVSSRVTLVSPFETNMSLDEISAVIEEQVKNIDALTIELSSIGDYYPSKPVVYWRVKNSDTLNTLYKCLYSKLDLALPCHDFYPHVTVAREISPHRLMLVKEQIYANLPDESFSASAIDLVGPAAGQVWVSVKTFPLGYRV
jgi:2'-5' RNA ligase